MKSLARRIQKLEQRAVPSPKQTASMRHTLARLKTGRRRGAQTSQRIKVKAGPGARPRAARENGWQPAGRS